MADAVAASAAFPILLPALSRTYEFQDSQGRREEYTLALTDGGIYDNLGLSPLMPDRSSTYTSHVYKLDYLIAIDADRGRARKTLLPYFPLRLYRAFDITYAKAQDGTRAQLNQAAGSGRIEGFVHAYLGMLDRNLPAPLADLVPRQAVAQYPTNFKAMTTANLNLMATRGEQLTRLLVSYYCRHLLGV